MAFRSVPRPSSPPGAKASTECPSYTRYFSGIDPGSRTLPPRSPLTSRSSPCTETILRQALAVAGHQLSETTVALTADAPRTALEISTPHSSDQPKSLHTTIPPDGHSVYRIRDTPRIQPTTSFTHASAHSPPNRWGTIPPECSAFKLARMQRTQTCPNAAHSKQDRHSRSDTRQNSGTARSSTDTPVHGSTPGRTRPETHQNLIYSYKEQTPGHNPGADRRRDRPSGSMPGAATTPKLETSAILAGRCPFPVRQPKTLMLTKTGSGDDRDRTGDPLLAKQVLSQLSYAPSSVVRLQKQCLATDISQRTSRN